MFFQSSLTQSSKKWLKKCTFANAIQDVFQALEGGREVMVIAFFLLKRKNIETEEEMRPAFSVK
mgnify:CR=1 FL=1